MNKIMTCGVLSFLVVSQSCATQPEFWLGWEDCRLEVGNERDGFRDAGAARWCRTDPSSADYCGVPYISKVPEESRWLLMFTAKGLPGCRQRSVIQESVDECETWRTFDDVSEIGCPPPLNASSTTFQCLGHNVVLCHAGNVRSVDGGHTWKQLRGEKDGRFSNSHVGSWDPPLVLKGSDGKHVLGTGYASRHSSLTHMSCIPLIRESNDAGLTWSPWRGIPEFLDACEVALAYNAKGEIVAGIRELSASDARNDESCRLSVSISRDNGQTWTPPKVVMGAGRHHPCFALLPDGRLVMTYVVREGYPVKDGKYAYGIEAVVSEDDGRTWDVRHRYVIARWEDDCMRTGADGRSRPILRYRPGPMCTTTHYLPKSDVLVTAFGRNDPPGGITMVKWRPLPKGAFTDEAAPMAVKPVAPDACLSALRAKSRWIAEYDASEGLPAGGWLLNYPRPSAIAKGGWLNLDHRNDNSLWCAALCGNQLEDMTGALSVRLRLKIPECPDEGRSDRFNFFASFGTGNERAFLNLHLDKNSDISTGLLGKVDLPVQTGKEFTLELWMDRESRTVRTWVDGQLVVDKHYEQDQVMAESFAQCFFGAYSSAVSGVVQIGEIKVGEVGL